MRRVLAVATGAVSAMVLSAGPALACGGLIGPNGAVNLTRTTTFAGYANGIEHYITAFNFAGGTGKFGSITPLPDVPTKVERGGDWTLQRLVRETTPVLAFAAAGSSEAASSAAAPAEAKVLLEAKVDALDITILKGNGAEVGRWAKRNGFRLPPDAPEVLDFYATRSPIFMAAAFDADRAKVAGQRVGDGTPIHLTIPTKAPWVPLRILGLGKQGAERVDADVYLLTEHRPEMLPKPVPVKLGRFEEGPGLILEYDQQASTQLLRDLHDDKSGSWVPLRSMWLSKLRVQQTAGLLKYDLAIDPSGAGKPSVRAAGYNLSGVRPHSPRPTQTVTVTAPPVAPSQGSAATGPLRLASAERTSRSAAGTIVTMLVVGVLALVVGVSLGRARRRTP